MTRNRVLFILLLALLLVGTANGATNLFSYPENPANALWNKYYTTAADNVALAPDGNTTAGTVNVSTSASDVHYIGQSTTITSGQPYTVSGYFKQYGSNKVIQLTLSYTRFGSTQYANFTTDGCALVSSAGTTATLNETAANGFCRFAMSATATSSGTGSGIFLFTGGGAGRAPFFTGDPSEAIYIWGMMLENNATASTYGTAGTSPPTVSAASFTTNKTATNAPVRAIQFTDTSDYSPNAWIWTHGDYHNATLVWTNFSTERNPIHSFGAGNFSIRLYARNSTYANQTPAFYYWLNVSAGNSDGLTWKDTIRYPTDNILHTNISNTTLFPVHPYSAQWLANLSLQCNSCTPGAHPHLTYPHALDTEAVYVINPANVTPVRMSSTTTYYDNVAPGVPIPDDALVPNGQAGDKPMTIIDPVNKIAYSLAGLTKRSNGTWTGASAIWNYSTNNNRYSAYAGTPTTANGNQWLGNNYVTTKDGTTLRYETLNVWGGRSMVNLPQWYSMVTYDEIATGNISHSLYIVVPCAGNLQNVTWPAINSGTSTTPICPTRAQCIGPGTFLRLKSSYDISWLPAKSKAIAQALKTYGGWVGDNGASYGASVYIADDPRWTAADTADFNHLDDIPLTNFEVVNVTSLMVSRYTMETTATTSPPVAHFFMSEVSEVVSDYLPQFGAPDTYMGYPLGGNYNGETSYPVYTAGVAAGGYDGSNITSKSELIAALGSATSGAVIFLNETADIDMGSTYGTTIPAGVTIASNRGYGGSLGGRIKTSTPGTGWEQSIFTTAGDNINLTGLRLEGESYAKDYEFSEATGRVGIKIYHNNVTIDNCDLKGFAYGDILSINIATAGRPWIHHNFIHESQNRHEGYGVEVQGGDCLVEANVFYKNRHSIAAYGLTNENYTYRYNKHLDVGTWDVVGAVHTDVHGSESTSEAYSGNRYDIYQNTYEGGHIAAIHQRGYPATGTYIYNNSIYGDAAYTGASTVIYQTYKTPPGAGHMYVFNNSWNDVEYATGSGIVWYQAG